MRGKTIFLAALVLLLASAAAAQGPVEYMDQALENALAKMKAIQDIDRVGFTRNHFGLLGGLFEKGQSMTQEITLSEGIQYVFLAGGDPDVVDMNIYLRDTSGAVIAKDDEPDVNPIVVYTPTTTGRYRIELKLENSQQNRDAFCVLLILKRVGN